jgi:hypothetical protein
MGRGSEGVPKRDWIASKEEIPLRAEVATIDAMAA